MKERPILFNGPMVRAILEGRKTQTRREAMHVYQSEIDQKLYWSGNKFGSCYAQDWGQRLWGKPGDRLWVRETFKVVPKTAYGFDREKHPHCWQVVRPDHNHDAAIFKEGWTRCTSGSWKPSIHMPRWACRLELEITSVRVERLHDISEEDAKAEGLIRGCKDGSLVKWGLPNWPWTDYLKDPREAFESLWRRTYSDSWEANPWVWVVEFKRVT